MNCHGFPKACDHKYLFNDRLDRFDYRLDRFDHRRSQRCSALGCVDTFADWSTFKSTSGTVPNSCSHSRACIKSNTHCYADSEADTITKPSTRRNASPTFTPSQIALHRASDARLRIGWQRDRNARAHTGDSKNSETPEQQHAACDENTSRVGCESFTGTHESTDRLFAGSTVKLPPMTEAELSEFVRNAENAIDGLLHLTTLQPGALCLWHKVIHR